jgi:hypothetical protein
MKVQVSSLSLEKTQKHGQRSKMIDSGGKNEHVQAF